MSDQVISIWKNTGLTSLDVVRLVKKEMNIKAKNVFCSSDNGV